MGVKAALQEHAVEDAAVVAAQELVPHSSVLADPRGLRSLQVGDQIVTVSVINEFLHCLLLSIGVGFDSASYGHPIKEAVPKRGLFPGSSVFLVAHCYAPLFRLCIAADAFSFRLQQFEQQSVYVLRGLSSLDQIIPEVVHPRNRQLALEIVQIYSVYLVSKQLPPSGSIVAEGGDFVECAKMVLKKHESATKIFIFYVIISLQTGGKGGETLWESTPMTRYAA